jgi:hypothetical protein
MTLLELRKKLPHLLLLIVVTAVFYAAMHYVKEGIDEIFRRGLIISEVLAVSSFFSTEKNDIKKVLIIGAFVGILTALMNIYFIPFERPG